MLDSFSLSFYKASTKHRDFLDKAIAQIQLSGVKNHPELLLRL